MTSAKIEQPHPVCLSYALMVIYIRSLDRSSVLSPPRLFTVVPEEASVARLQLLRTIVEPTSRPSTYTTVSGPYDGILQLVFRNKLRLLSA